MACMIVSRFSSSLLGIYCLLMALPLPLLVPALAPLEADRFVFLDLEWYFCFLVVGLGSSGDSWAEVEGVGVAGGDWGSS